MSGLDTERLMEYGPLKQPTKFKNKTYTVKNTNDYNQTDFGYKGANKKQN